MVLNVDQKVTWLSGTSIPAAAATDSVMTLAWETYKSASEWSLQYVSAWGGHILIIIANYCNQLETTHAGPTDVPKHRSQVSCVQWFSVLRLEKTCVFNGSACSDSRKLARKSSEHLDFFGFSGLAVSQAAGEHHSWRRPGVQLGRESISESCQWSVRSELELTFATKQMMLTSRDV